jgi:phenylalanyl-tRNA synthetase beta chain
MPMKLTPQEISTILTSVGLEVEGMDAFETIKGNLKGIVIGKVQTCLPHLNADKLKITTVDIGESTPVQIVCGASNVAEGQTVVVATVGATLYPIKGEWFEIKKAKIRGEESFGMICAEDEIGLGESHDGIIVLTEDVKPGTVASEYYKLPTADVVFEIGLTPNRMDAMSHMGCVKDILAYLSNRDNQQYIAKIPTIKIEQINAKGNINISIEDDSICARYAGLELQHIKVAESPEWLQLKLKAIGLRPINNVVDITNFVMHECGQPLHAFDLQKIAGNEIRIKTVPDKTLFKTLDDKERTLSADDLMICDAEKPMCIAGVYGGADSGVTNNTTSIFLESAWFNAESIRKTSVRHGLRTDASIRFEKGADISNVPFALQRAASLLQELAGATIASQMIDVYPTPKEATLIDVPFEKINQIVGKKYTPSQIKNILTSLCFETIAETPAALTVKVPHSKPDISMLADVVEEIMRIDGLDNIPFTGNIQYNVPSFTKGYTLDVKKQLAQTLVGKGFYEIFTNSITNASYFENQAEVVTMKNSLSANLDCMRFSMLETGLEVLSYNINRKNTDLKFFEFGKVYSKTETKFIEEEKCCLYITGNSNAESWIEKQKPVDIYVVKGIVQNLFPALSLSINDKLELIVNKKIVGNIQQVSNEKRKQFDIKQPVFFVEMNWTDLKNLVQTKKIKYVEIPKFPAVRRDLALILSKEINYIEVEKAIKKANASHLVSTNVFDVFENEKLGTNKKSYALSFTFSDSEKTLTDVEIETSMQKIIDALKSNVQAEIRSN